MVVCAPIPVSGDIERCFVKKNDATNMVNALMNVFYVLESEKRTHSRGTIGSPNCPE